MHTSAGNSQSECRKNIQNMGHYLIWDTLLQGKKFGGKNECAFKKKFKTMKGLVSRNSMLYTPYELIYHCWDCSWKLNEGHFTWPGLRKTGVPTMRPNNVGRPNSVLWKTHENPNNYTCIHSPTHTHTHTHTHRRQNFLPHYPKHLHFMHVKQNS